MDRRPFERGSVKSLVTLFLKVLDDVGGFCSVDTIRDVKTVTERYEHEGFEFFTRILPRYGTGLETALRHGASSPDLYPSFKCRQKTPVFLGGFMDLVFDRASGALLDEPSTEAIRSLRQLTLLFKKIEIDCGAKRTADAFASFVKSDVEVGEWEDSADPELLAEFARICKIIYSSELSAVNRKVATFDLVPSHGPGATADRLLGNTKYEMPSWTQRLEDVAPLGRYADFRGYSSDRYDRTDFHSPERELPVRVISVPKTAETPRIIAIEPTCMQYMQQAVARQIKWEVDRTFLSSLIGTTYQLPNQEMAMVGSRDGTHATLDLSEASDRVSNLLVTKLFEPYPDLHDLVQACRSLRADVPGHGVLPLRRFASMGSALTFPVETMVFLAVVCIGIQRARCTRFTNHKDLFDLVGQVRIYGDDIIVPVDTVTSVVLTLELFGFKVNGHKSFWTGKFRESCGKEYFGGEDVTLCRVRRVLPTDRKAVKELKSAVEFRNHAYLRGLWKTAKWMDDYLTGIIPMPAVTESSTVLGRLSFLGFDSERECPKLHRPMVKGAVIKHRKRLSTTDGDAALMKCLAFQNPFQDEEWSDLLNGKTVRHAQDDHLTYAGRPDASSINIRWGYPV